MKFHMQDKINSISSTKDPFGIALGFAAALGWIFQFIFAPTWNYKKTKSWKEQMILIVAVSRK